MPYGHNFVCWSDFDMSILGPRLREIRKKSRLSQEDFSRKLGVDKTTIGRYERGERVPDAAFLQILGRAFKFDANWLLFGVTAPEDDVIGVLSEDRERPLKSAPAQKGTGRWQVTKVIDADDSALGAPTHVDIPGLGFGDITGNGPVFDENMECLALKPNWLEANLGTSPDALATLIARGDAMKPTITEGDVLLVDTTFRQATEDAVYVLYQDDQVKIRRFQRLIDGQMLIKTDNTAYTEETLDPETADALDIRGRVLRVLREL